VTNAFFGPGITVSGLLTGQDILGRLAEGSGWDLVLLPPNCVNGDGVTLDDLSVPRLAEAAGIPVAVGDYDLAACVAGCLDGTWTAVTGTGRQLAELGYRYAGARP
jgi:NifB/MoaA-like Fe-S oxidoreductase